MSLFQIKFHVMTYEDGTKVYVNFNYSDYTGTGFTVGGKKLLYKERRGVRWKTLMLSMEMPACLRQRKKKMTLGKKMRFAGYLFILPFIIGFITFLAYPLIESVQMSFCNVKIGVGGFTKVLTA